MHLTRKNNWPELLEGRLMQLSHEPFQYGTHDCCKLTSGIIQLLTQAGLDISKDFASYTTRIGALRALKKFGCDTVEAFAEKVTNQYKIPEVSISLAQRGDIILGLDDDLGTALGICIGIHGAFADNGIKYIPMSRVLRAWHYG